MDLLNGKDPKTFLMFDCDYEQLVLGIISLIADFRPDYTIECLTPYDDDEFDLALRERMASPAIATLEQVLEPVPGWMSPKVERYAKALVGRHKRLIQSTMREDC